MWFSPSVWVRTLALHAVREWSIPASRRECATDIGESRYDESVFHQIEWDLDTADDRVAAIGGYGDRSTGGGGHLPGTSDQDAVLA